MTTAAVCTKVRFSSRRRARRARARIIGDGRADQRMRPYLCRGCGFWHLGHLALQVRQGRASRADVYRDAA